MRKKPISPQALHEAHSAHMNLAFDEVVGHINTKLKGMWDGIERKFTIDVPIINLSPLVTQRVHEAYLGEGWEEVIFRKQQTENVVVLKAPEKIQ